MNIVIARGDDWEGLYIDGVLKTEGHSLDVFSVLEIVGERQEVLTSTAQKWVNLAWLYYHGSLPSSIDEIVWEGEHWEDPLRDDFDEDDESNDPF